MKVIVTGASGLLGSNIVDYLHQQGVEVAGFDRKQFSWGSTEHNRQLLSGFDVVIHAAANTNVEQCEEEPDACYQDNTLLTERLAIAANMADCKFVYISSTGIYGTEKEAEAYIDYDEVNPTTHHHRAKWLGEESVRQVCHNALILRTGWIFGGSPLNRKNFIARRIEESLNCQARTMYSNHQQIGSPTFVGDFAERLYLLLKNDEIGTFNLVNSGSASRYDYVQAILNVIGSQVELLPVDAAAFNRKAQVSNNESAVNLKMQQLGYADLPEWQVSLAKYIQTDLSAWIAQQTLQT
ncbi:dTDP-4-dehydrorhamnose reductase [uncultured Thiomicrorhabdus sp.]